VDCWNSEKGSARGPVLPLHRLFGCNLASRFIFSSSLSPGEGSADLTFQASSGPPPVELWPELTPIYRSPQILEDGESFSYLYRLPECEVLRFSHVADFYLGADRIVSHLLDPAYRHLLELRLLGPVFCYWLERLGLPVLHASAVRLPEGAAAFLSNNHGGKTGLAAALLQAGGQLLTDDLLAVEETASGVFLARPSYPQMRMWPDEATYFLGGYEDLAIVHPDYTKRRVPVGAGFSPLPAPLAALYLPERQDPSRREIEIVPVSPSQAVLAVVRHSFSPYLVEAVGWQPRRLELFSRMVKAVPVRRLRYPSGFAELPRVAEALRRDLSRGGG
jgi:hypothetical protein